MAIQDQISELLKDLPSKWRDQLTQLLCQIYNDKNSVDCEKVKECETVTSLSQFEVDGTVVSITYVDENSVEVTRTFDVNQLINNKLEGIDASCLTDAETWANMSLVERVQMFIDSHCDCCSTTTTSTSTTTTTTV